jgi:hypothetical protein
VFQYHVLTNQQLNQAVGITHQPAGFSSIATSNTARTRTSVRQIGSVSQFSPSASHSSTLK